MDKEDQAVLDKDHLKCGVRPGCYFDVELFQLRDNLSPSTLAGVPTCHHAIRKPAFKEKALLVVQKVSPMWSSYSRVTKPDIQRELERENYILPIVKITVPVNE